MTLHSVRRLDLFVTERCNLACDYCFAASHPQRDPTVEQLLRSVDWLMQSTADRVHITLWGGEPLLREAQLRQVVGHARESAAASDKTVSFSLPTNASLIGAQTMAWLCDEEVEIFLSIDGDELGQRSRPLRAGGSSHEMVSRGMGHALAAGRVPPAIRMTVAPDNARRLAANVRYFLACGAQQLIICAANDQPWSAAEIDLYVQGQLALADLFVEIVSRRQEGALLPRFKMWQPILARLFDGERPRTREGPLQHCGVGSELVAVGVDGRLWPCHRFVFYGRDRDDHRGVGSLTEGIIVERAAPFGRLRIEDMHGVVRCVDCELFDLCTQGCLAINFGATGELSRVPPSACELMRAQVQACRRVHEQLCGNPVYARYLGRPAREALNHLSARLGARALSEYHRRRVNDHDGGADDEQANQ